MKVPIGQSLSRLTIAAYVDRERKYPISNLTAMYNPESLTLGYRNDFLETHPTNTPAGQTNYRKRELENLSLDLLFDAKLPGNDVYSVDERLAQLRKLCSALDADAGEPHFLRLTWGKMKWDGDGYFAGRLEKMTTVYSLFDRNGAPLRATASMTFIADNSAQIQKSRTGLSTPATSVMRLSPGDNLPALDANPTRLAIRNELDSFYSGRGRQLAIESGRPAKQLAIEFNPGWRNP